MKNQQRREPMDNRIQEIREPVMATNTPRVCWTLKTLVAEFTELFPETSAEYGGRDGRNTAINVTLYLGDLVEDDEMLATALLRLTISDPRIAYVEAEDSNVLVEVVVGPHTQDSREPFHLGEALTVLDEADGGSM